MNITVTGANSYLGYCVINRLESQFHNINKFDSHGRMIGVLQFPFEKTQVVVHLAWRSHAGNSEREAQENCFNRTYMLIQAAQKIRPLIVFASSAAVYGNTGGEITESSKLNPNCHYGHYKAMAEIEFGKSRLPVCSIRFGSLMGKGELRTKRDLIVNAFTFDGYEKRKVEVWNPDCYKPVLHVRDAATIIGMAIRNRWLGVVNACQGSFRAGEIGRVVAEMTQSELTEIQAPTSGPKKSCILKCDHLIRLMNLHHEGLKMKRVYDAVAELKGYKPTQEDEPRPWRI